jgi:hypothetical protein
MQTKLSRPYKCVLVLVIVILLMTGCENNDMKYNNEILSKNVITQTYSEESIENLFQLFTEGGGQLTIDYLKKNYKIECVRKVLQEGYYIVLYHQSGERIFVFYNNNNVITNILKYDKFLSQNDFSFVIEEITTMQEILGFDDKTFLMPISAYTFTAHIIKEGLIVIKYAKNSDVVEKVTIYSNDELISETGVYNIYQLVPLILPIDK